MHQKKYLVIGGSSGVGLATAKLLSERGNRVILVSGNFEKLSNALSQLNGDNHNIIVCDLSNADNVAQIFADLEKNNIVLDGMVYTAGVAPLCLLKDNTVELMSEVFHINFFSFVEAVKYFYKEEISCEGSRIVAVSSVASHSAGYRQTLYGSSKSAMESATKLMAKELLNRNIRINCISPAAIFTSMYEKLAEQSSSFKDNIKSTQPLGVIPAEVIAKQIVYMLNEGSDYCTGSTIHIEAGAQLK